jgi:hypothetical protein
MPCPHTNVLRPELEPLPARMRTLPVDERGYVVPWFVAWEDGKPEFRAMDTGKWVRAINNRLCWVCGERMGKWVTFVIGPMCGINRTSSEPPCHLDCARWSARNCPFLNNPEMMRRPDPRIDMSKVAGIAITRNPGVVMLWTTKDYSVFKDQRNMPLITFGDPESVEWYACSKIATREQVIASVDSGFPALLAAAMTEQGGVKHLEEARTRFEKYLPT